MIPDDQFMIDFNWQHRDASPTIKEDVERFLEVFQFPKALPEVIYDACVEFFRPLPEEVEPIKEVVKAWCTQC